MTGAVVKPKEPGLPGAEVPLPSPVHALSHSIHTHCAPAVYQPCGKWLMGDGGCARSGPFPGGSFRVHWPHFMSSCMMTAVVIQQQTVTRCHPVLSQPCGVGTVLPTLQMGKARLGGHRSYHGQATSRGRARVCSPDKKKETPKQRPATLAAPSLTLCGAGHPPGGLEVNRLLGSRVSRWRGWPEEDRALGGAGGGAAQACGSLRAAWCQAMGSQRPELLPARSRGCRGAVGRARPASTLSPRHRSLHLHCPRTATVNNSSDTESIPSPRTEAAKDTAQSGPKPPPTPGVDAPPPEPPSPPPEDAPAPSEPAPAPEAACPPVTPPAPASPAAAPAVVPKEEKEEEAAAAPSAEEGEEQKPPAAQELAADVGKTEEPGEVPPSEPIKSEREEEAAEEGPDKVKGGAEAAAEATPEGAPKVEKKEGGGPGGKGPAAKGSGAPQDSDSSATCSADEVDEPEGGDKNR